MKTIPEPITFEWDEGNIDKNLKKHGIINKEGEEIFKNKPLFISQDIKHSQKELRFEALAITDSKKLIFLSFTIRNNKVRIISVRDMSRRERRVYETKTQTNTKI